MTLDPHHEPISLFVVSRKMALLLAALLVLVVGVILTAFYLQAYPPAPMRPIGYTAPASSSPGPDINLWAQPAEDAGRRYIVATNSRACSVSALGTRYCIEAADIAKRGQHRYPSDSLEPNGVEACVTNNPTAENQYASLFASLVGSPLTCLRISDIWVYGTAVRK